jgi:hypothetical protein
MEGRGLEGIQKLQRTFNMSPRELEAFLLQVGGKDDKAMLSFIQGMDSYTGLGAVTRTREEWLTTFDDLAGGPTAASQTYRRAAEYLRTRHAAED